MPKSSRKPLEWSKWARRDLLSIEAARAEYSEITAARVMDAIRSRALTLERHALLGEEGPRQGARHIPVDAYPYVIHYRVKPRSVLVLRVLHARRRQPGEVV